MKLVNINTLDIREFNDAKNAPFYAILSHRWEAREISYEQYMDPARRNGPGFEKIRDFCAFLRDFDWRVRFPKIHASNLEWCWIDTCCIDKRSSADLSESINSMAKWYLHSLFCVVYLSDVSASPDPEEWRPAFKKSQWFGRGWTLQELLFPHRLVFCDKGWSLLTRLQDSSDLVAGITGIPAACLQKRNTAYEYSVACRMSWASQRKTTREEDKAYCLLGLFEINMPLLYGEGSKSFQRLQEAIIRQSRDESILAWQGHTMGALARSPSDFSNGGNVKPHRGSPNKVYRLTDRGVEIEADALRFRNRREPDHHLAEEIDLIALDCYWHDTDSSRSTAVMIAVKKGTGGWTRAWPYHSGEKLIRSLKASLVSLGPVVRRTYLLNFGLLTSDRIIGFANRDAPGNLWTLDDVHKDWIRQGLETSSRHAAAGDTAVAVATSSTAGASSGHDGASSTAGATTSWECTSRTKRRRI